MSAGHFGDFRPENLSFAFGGLSPLIICSISSSDFHVDARFVQALRRIGQIELRRYAEQFAGVAHHRLHDGAVILHPVEPRRVPDPGVMHRRGGAGVVFRLLQVDRKHLVADPVERVEPSVTFQDALGGDALFQVLDLLVLIENLVELVLQRLAVVDAWSPARGCARRSGRTGRASSASATSAMPMPCFIVKRSVSAGPPSMTTAVSL